MKAEFLARRCGFAGARRLARRAFVAALALAATVIGAGLGRAQQPGGIPSPRLMAIFPAGGQRGASFEVTIAGVDLDDVHQLQFSDAGISAVQKTVDPGLPPMAPQPVAGQFIVTIKPDVKTGLHDVRTVGHYGVSTPRAFMVGSLPEITEKEPNNSVSQAQAVSVGSTINGQTLSAADQDFFKFSAKRGQRLSFDCWAYRIDSRMDATLVLFNGAGEELARNRDTNRIDPLIDFIMPADGDYYVAVYDFLYAGSTDNFYRLTISAAPYIDFVFPPVGQAGTNGKYTVYGSNLPGGKPAPQVVVGGKALEMLDVQIQLPGGAAANDLGWTADVSPSESGMDGVAYHLDSPQGPSNSVLLGVTTTPVIVEQEPNDTPEKAQRITTPCEICGQFNPRRDQDWYAFEAKKGDVFWIEVYSERLGMPTDPYLLVQQVTKSGGGAAEEVKELQVMDDMASPSKGQVLFDTSTEDPSYRFVAPADGLVRVMVRNLYYTSTGDPRHLYRMAIRPPQPDFRLVAVPRSLPNGNQQNDNKPSVVSAVLRRGGAAVLEVYLHRREGFDGDVVVSAAGLPAGVSAAPLTISTGRNFGYLVIQAADNAPEGNGALEIVGTAKIGQADGKAEAQQVTRKARSATLVWTPLKQQDQSPPRGRLARTLPVAVIAEQAPYTLELGQNPVFEVSRAGSIKLPIKVVRHADVKEKISLQVLGLPKELTPPAGGVDANAGEASLEIKVPMATRPGDYSFSVLGTSSINYIRNPEAVQVAQAQKLTLDKIVAERNTEAKKAADAKAAAEKAATDQAQALLKATETGKTAQKAEAEAAAAAKSAADQLKATQDAAAKEPAGAGLAEAKQAADQKSQEAAAKLKVAADARTAADAAVGAATQAAKAAADAKTAANAAAIAATAKVTAATTFQQSFNQTVNDLVSKTKPNKVNLGVSSAGITLRVLSAPITLSLGQQETSGSQRAKIEVPITITRIAGFADAVEIRVKLPGGAKGITIAPIHLAADRNTVPLVLGLGPEATPGKHKLTVEAVAKLGGQELVAGEELSLTVEKADPEAK